MPVFYENVSSAFLSLICTGQIFSVVKVIFSVYSPTALINFEGLKKNKTIYSLCVLTKLTRKREVKFSIFIHQYVSPIKPLDESG
jgi:hypothetical protein